ncbi:MAG: Nif11 family protein [Cyanobacteriota bacterium]|nr:Nif11 family protein [Cyanobacteriota bacterium]
MAAEGLEGFFSSVMAEEVLQVRLRRCETVQAIIELAAECGYALSYLDLRLGITDPALACDHWPWSGLGSQARRLFFLRAAGDGAL